MSDSDEEEEGQERDDDSSSTSSDDEPVKQFSFPQLDGEIRSVLSKYEGAVFPKLNRSSPQVRQGLVGISLESQLIPILFLT